MQLQISVPHYKFDRAFFKFHALRILVILTLSLAFVHLLVYNKLPFHTGYDFPLNQFLIISFFGFMVCSANWLVFESIDIPDKSNIKKYIAQRILLHTLTTLVAYSLLYVLITNNFTLLGFLKGFQMCLGVVLIEFLLFELIKTRQLDNSAENMESIVVQSGKRMIPISFDNIAICHSHSGIISIKLKTNEKLVTDFTSLDELEQKFPEEKFFRINRQFLVARDTITSVIKEKNRKLLVTLNHHISPAHDIMISRYRSKEFKEWLKQS